MNVSLENAVLKFLEQKKGLKHDNMSLSNDDYPSISIGICAKNSEATVGECLKSIASSDYDKSLLEIIFVDGNSVDNTVPIAKDVLEKNSMTFKIFSDEGKGLGYARQLVVDNSKGKYICWVDSDNILSHGFLKNHVEFAEKNHGVSLFVPIILYKGQYALARLEGYSWLLPTLNAVGKQKMPHLAMQGTLTPVKLLRRVGGFNKLIKGAGEDTELFYRMKEQGHKVVVNPKAWIYHWMRASWKSLYKQVSWWAKTQPLLSKTQLFKQVMWRNMLYLKLFPLIISYFKDPVGIFMPLYVVIWNTWYFLHSLP